MGVVVVVVSWRMVEGWALADELDVDWCQAFYGSRCRAWRSSGLVVVESSARGVRAFRGRAPGAV